MKSSVLSLFPFVFGLFWPQSKIHILWFSGIYDLPILVESFCLLSFCGQHISSWTWIFKQCNFCFAPGHGSSTLCASLPSSAITLCPLVLLKCHQEGPQQIQGEESCSRNSWIIQRCVSTGGKKGTLCSIFISLITLIRHYLKERWLLIHFPQRRPQSNSKAAILISVRNFYSLCFTPFYFLNQSMSWSIHTFSHRYSCQWWKKLVGTSTVPKIRMDDIKLAHEAMGRMFSSNTWAPEAGILLTGTEQKNKVTGLQVSLWISFSSELRLYSSTDMNILVPSPVVPPYPWGIRSKMPTGCLKPRIVQNPMYVMIFPIHTFLW